MNLFYEYKEKYMEVYKKCVSPEAKHTIEYMWDITDKSLPIEYILERMEWVRINIDFSVTSQNTQEHE